MEAIETIFKATFAELNESQKEQAVEVMRDIENCDSTPYWSVEQCNNLKEELDSDYGIHEADIQWSGFCCQGDGASISTDYYIDLEKFLRRVKAWSKFRPLHRMIADNVIHAKVIRSSGRYSHSNMVSGEVSFDWGVDYTTTQENTSVVLEELLTDTIRSLSDQLYKDLEAENTYHSSTEALTELIEMNDYHFKVDQDGNVLSLA